MVKVTVTYKDGTSRTHDFTVEPTVTVTGSIYKLTTTGHTVYVQSTELREVLVKTVP